MPHIIFRPKFQRDVVAIWKYIAKDQVGNANVWVESLDRSLERLASQPRMGEICSVLDDGFRYLPFGSYLIFYKPISNGIEVYRIIHKARKISQAWHV